MSILLPLHPSSTRSDHDPATNARWDVKSSSSGLVPSVSRLIREPSSAIFGSLFEAAAPSTGTDAGDADSSRKQVLLLRLRNAESYSDWRTAALELDALLGNNEWKHEDHCAHYDVGLVLSRLKQLEDARISCDERQMLFLIRTSLTRNLGGMGDSELYRHSYVGTKRIIEDYIGAAVQTIEKLVELSAQPGCDLEPREVLDQMLATRQAFGRSALLLSGGGTFGMNHIGVVKCLWMEKLLPRIFSGSSAGSIVCSVLATKTDEEVPDVLRQFCYGDLAVFEAEGEEEGLLKKAARFLKHGALFDIQHLTRVMKALLGDMTFQEAYNRTRRILNICVSSASLYELPRLLNYVTAPNVLIWSAVAASCSVPLIFNTGSLMAKDPRTGLQVPWNPSAEGWIDGSVDNDLPMTRLSEMFNVNHFIVSQVNPHVVPFLAREEDNMAFSTDAGHSAFTAGPGWLHSMANLAKNEALHRLHVLADLGVMPNQMTKLRSVLSQRYSGDITIFPEISYSQFPLVLKNPTTDFMLQATAAGERASWPKLSRIQNHCAIELALDRAVQVLRERVAFSPSQINLRLNSYGKSKGSSGRGRRRNTLKEGSKRPSKSTGPDMVQVSAMSIVQLSTPQRTMARSDSFQDMPERVQHMSLKESETSPIYSTSSSSETPPRVFHSVSQPTTPYLHRGGFP